MAEPPPYPGAPRWVKRLAIVAGLIVILLVSHKITGIGGHHGTGRDARAINGNDHAKGKQPL